MVSGAPLTIDRGTGPDELAASGYNCRALVEANISRFKRVVGDGLRSRTDRRRATEVAIAVGVLNRMLDLGRPEYVRTAWNRDRQGRRPSDPMIRAPQASSRFLMLSVI